MNLVILKYCIICILILMCYNFITFYSVMTDMTYATPTLTDETFSAFTCSLDDSCLLQNIIIILS